MRESLKAVDKTYCLRLLANCSSIEDIVTELGWIKTRISKNIKKFTKKCFSSTKSSRSRKFLGKSYFSKKDLKMAGERYNIHSQLEHLQSKYIGTGHADTTKHEWLTNQHRDTYASILGHFDMLNYMSICENESKARVKFNIVEKMLQPCGPPPEKPED